ncbi:MAG: phosphate-starvation-inducible PsiE family protein [Candidatus Angelobacter sp.]
MPHKLGMVRDFKHDVPHTQVHRIARQLLEPAQDLLVLGIGLALFGLMVRTLIWLFRAIIVRGNLDYRGVIAQVLFMLVMVEVVRLVIIYLEEHRIAVDFMVELGIVATLREVVLRGVTELAWQEVIALTGFLLALGALLRFGDLRAGLKLKNGGFQADPTFLPRDTDQISEETR